MPAAPRQTIGEVRAGQATIRRFPKSVRDLIHDLERKAAGFLDDEDLLASDLVVDQRAVELLESDRALCRISLVLRSPSGERPGIIYVERVLLGHRAEVVRDIGLEFGGCGLDRVENAIVGVQVACGLAIDVACERDTLGPRQRLRPVCERAEYWSRACMARRKRVLAVSGSPVRSDTNTLSVSVTVAWESPIGSVRVRPRAVSRSAFFTFTLR